MNETEKINQIHLTSTTVIGLQAVNSDIKCETFKLVKAT